MEIWKTIPEHEGYEASTYGRIRKKSNKHICKQHKLNNGYMQVRVGDKQYSVHRLVAITFIPNPEDKPMVNHLNEIKHDNSVGNLSWVTAKENMNWNCLNIRMYHGEKKVYYNGYIYDSIKSMCKANGLLDKYKQVTKVFRSGRVPNSLGLVNFKYI